MIQVEIKLRSARGRKYDRILGVVVIANDGTGTAEEGNYEFALSHAGVYFGKRKEPYKKGKVKGFKRNLSPYRLLYRVLKKAGEL